MAIRAHFLLLYSLYAMFQDHTDELNSNIEWNAPKTTLSWLWEVKGLMWVDEEWYGPHFITCLLALSPKGGTTYVKDF